MPKIFWSLSLLHSATGREVFDWILDQGYYSERDTSNVVRQVLEAVAYLHSLQIVHRNLKVSFYCYKTLNFTLNDPLLGTGKLFTLETGQTDTQDMI